jgi:hypothetical protein
MKRLNRSRAVLASAALLLALGPVACGSPVAPESVLAPAGNAAATTLTADRGSWNGWHVHDGTAPPYTDETGLTHTGLAIFPQIFEDYATTPSLHAYCPDGVDKGLVGGDGGSKEASGICQNEDNLIHVQINANGAPSPAGWIALPLRPGFTFYYRLTPR